MFKKIVVGNDGSDHAAEAIAEAADMAYKDAELIIAHVWHVPATAYIGAPYAPLDLTKQMEEAREAASKKATDVLRDKSVRYRMVDLEGNPADALCELADKEDADLIVVGSRGMGAVERFIVGSTSDRVVHHAPCDVLVVR